jgi:hypothetical protein
MKHPTYITHKSHPLNKGELHFHALWDGSTFETKGKPFRKVSNAVSIDLKTGKDACFALHDVCKPIPERLLYKKHDISWLK